MRIGCVDIGSNAVRTQIVEFGDNHYFKTLYQKRYPIRLGKSVFTNGKLKKKLIAAVAQKLLSFSNKLEKYSVDTHRLVATSACREASNVQELLDVVYESSGLLIEVIDGAEEARLVQSAISKLINPKIKNWLFMDLGGGSLEIGIANRNRLEEVHTLPLGAVRIMREFTNPIFDFSGAKSHSKRVLKEALNRNLKSYSDFKRIYATGGNVQSYSRLIDNSIKNKKREFVKDVSSIPAAGIKNWTNKLASADSILRSVKYGVHHSRSDVIVPAGIVCLEIIGLLNLEFIEVPQVGLRDGLLIDLYNSKLENSEIKILKGVKVNG